MSALPRDVCKASGSSCASNLKAHNRSADCADCLDIAFFGVCFEQTDACINQ